MTGFRTALGTVAMLALGAGSATAASLTLTDIGAAWTAWSGGSAVAAGASGTTAQLRWGIPRQGNKSGYDFTPSATPLNPVQNTDFDLGRFTHFNYPIATRTGIDEATLEVSFSFYLGDDSRNIITRTSRFVFDHWETRNQARRCADGGENGAGVNVNGCADRVRAVNNPSRSETFEVEEGGATTRYSFSVTGFDIGQDFWTTERAVNTAVLRGRYFAETLARPTVPPGPAPNPAPKPNPGPNPGPGVGPLPEPMPAPIPLPAAGWMLLAGLGALTAAGRRRKTA